MRAKPQFNPITEEYRQGWTHDGHDGIELSVDSGDDSDKTLDFDTYEYKSITVGLKRRRATEDEP